LPSDLNNRGEIAGTVSDEGGSHPAIWRNGRIVELFPRIPDTEESNFVVAINDHGEVVGTHEFPGGVTSFFLTPPQGGIDIGAPPGDPGFVNAEGINNRRQIIIDTAFPWGNFLWERGMFTPLDSPPGASSMGTELTELNDFGEVVGQGTFEDGIRALLWREGTVEILGVLPGTNMSTARDINNQGDIIGNSFTPGAADRAFLWREGEMKALPLLRPDPREINFAQAINDWGQIVGYETNLDDPGNQTAVLWQHGRPLPLTKLVKREHAHVTFTSAEMINERGQIVAIGFDSRISEQTLQVYLLTPIF
jgi:probable HAF family extracellular repeat protein